MEENTSPSFKKPKWLRKLEQESWQAELIISGLAIFGSLQLPQAMLQLVDWVINFFDPHNYLWAYAFFIYLSFAVFFVIIAFIIHFVLRALWVGLIGLNSVFPNGINPDGGIFNRHFMDQLMEDIPFNNDKAINQLDNFCSGIFGYCANTMLTFMALTTNILVFFLFRTLLTFVMPESIANIITGFIFGTLLLLLLASSLMNVKTFKDRAWVKKYHYPVFSKVTRIFYHIFYYPLTYLGFLFSTNMSFKRHTTSIGLGMIPFMGIVMFFLINSNVLMLTTSDRLLKHFDRADRAFPESFENYYEEKNTRILTAVIEHEEVYGNQMKVFVPILSNESTITDSLCGEWEREDLFDEEEKKARYQYYFDCYSRYHRFYVNDSLYQLEIVKYAHPNQGENGILTYVPTKYFRNGKNILKIEKIRNEKGEVYRSFQIPFWFAGGE